MNTRKKLRLAWHLSPQTSINVFDKRYMSNTYNIQEDNSTSITGVLTLRNPSIANRGGSKNDVADQNDATGLTQNSTSMWSYSGVLWKQTCQHSHEQQQSQQWWFLALCTPRTHVRPLKPVGILEWKIGSQPATYLNNFPGLDRKELDINGELKKKNIVQLVLSASDVRWKIFADAFTLWENRYCLSAFDIRKNLPKSVAQHQKVGHVNEWFWQL